MNEAEISIDIHVLKLQDWLYSRRIVPKNAQNSIKQIRGKIDALLKDKTASQDVLETLSKDKPSLSLPTSIHYYQCKDIIDILKEKEIKNVFGSYSSQRMKDWQEVIRLYEKDNIYLGETAQIYVRNINYEIPGVRKQMTKLEQQVDECLKRIQDLGKPEAQLHAEHAALLTQLGVKGENLRSELMEVLGTLPHLYNKSIHDIRVVQKAIDLYSECCDQKVCLPILRHLIKFGNTTVYQYVHNEPPLRVEEPQIMLQFTEEDEQPTEDNTISFDIDDIDFNIENVESTGDSEEIDWGIEDTSVEVVDIDLEASNEKYDIVVESSGMDGGVAKGEQAYTILDSSVYRDRFLDELYELESFLRLRLYELSQPHGANIIMLSLMDNISTHDAQSIQKMLADVEHILQESSNERTCHLFQLKHSPKYADLIKTKLKQMTKAIEKIIATKETLKDRIVQLKKERQQLNPILVELLAETKKLQKNIEKDISKRYKNREVNLLGGVN